MINNLSLELDAAPASPKASQPAVATRQPYRLLSSLFGGRPARESVATHLCVEASLEAVWRKIRFYEEIPGRPPLALRALTPRPLRTEGGKTREGAFIVCTYVTGSLVKRITTIERERLIGFDVIEQHLGIESCVVAQSGAYRLRRRGDGADIELTTHYLTYLHPRWMWRPLERKVVHLLHRYILNGMLKAIAPAATPAGRGVADVCQRGMAFEGEEGCTSQSRSRR